MSYEALTRVRTDQFNLTYIGSRRTGVQITQLRDRLVLSYCLDTCWTDWCISLNQWCRRSPAYWGLGPQAPYRGFALSTTGRLLFPDPSRNRLSTPGTDPATFVQSGPLKSLVLLSRQIEDQRYILVICFCLNKVTNYKKPASTHKSAKTHAGNGFVTRDLVL